MSSPISTRRCARANRTTGYCCGFSAVPSARPGTGTGSASNAEASARFWSCRAVSAVIASRACSLISRPNRCASAGRAVAARGVSRWTRALRSQVDRPWLASLSAWFRSGLNGASMMIVRFRSSRRTGGRVACTSARSVAIRGERADLGGHLDLVRVGQLDHGGEAGEREHVGLGRAVVAAAGDRPARGDQVRVVGEGQGDLAAVAVAAQIGAGLAVLLLAPVLRVLAGALAGLLASSGFQLVRACRAGQVVVADPGGGELAAVLAQHVPRGQRRVIGPQRRRASGART